MRPCRLLLAVLAAAAVSPVSPVATTKRRFGDDDSDSAVINSAAADSGARHTPKDWGINGGQIYFDEISGQFKARPPGGSSSVSRKSNEDERRKDDLRSSKTGGEGLDIVSSVRTRGQSTEEDAGGRLSNKVLKRRKKWRKTTLTAAAASGDAEENEVGGESLDPDEGEEEGAGSEATRARDNAADDILAKARWRR
jgi:hypothetical protein